MRPSLAPRLLRARHGVVTRAFGARIGVLAVAFALLTPTSGCAQATGSPGEQAQTALNSGRYDEARRLFGDLAAETRADDAVRGYARTFEAIGDYAEGIAAIDRLLADGLPSSALHHARGRLLALVGRYEEAGMAYVRALELQPECWACRADLGDLLVRTGRARQASSLYADIYLTWEQNVFRTAPELTVAGRAAAALGRFRDANTAFRTAHEIAPRDVENLFAWADLFRMKFNEADARRTFEEALATNPRHAPSLVGMARSGFNFERQEELARAALEVNPSLTEALDLLASLQILDGQYDDADRLAGRALDVNPNAVSSLAQRASIQFLRGDDAAFDAAEARALEVDGRASDFYLAVAENATYRFRYLDAVRFAEEAVRTNVRDPRALAAYGTALLRLGNRSDARRHLEAAFEADPFNLFASNQLTLLDQIEEFSEFESPHFRLLIHRDEAEALGPLILETAEEAFAELRQRYPYEPADPILIEAYNDADDFAVRVAGVPHRGLLGVCFGDVVAINTPVAQTGQPYNWARTLWHEIAHTMAIGVSRYHVPRWFTEGLSVYEEQRARPEWGREMKLALLSAHDEGRLLPLAQIDRGFTRPSYPGQVILSYYHASRFIELIVEDHGFDAVTRILEGFGQGMTTAEAVSAAIDTDLAQLDGRLQAKLEEEQGRLRQAMEGLPDLLAAEEADVTAEAAASAGGAFFERLHQGSRNLERGDFAAAEAAYQEALGLFAEYVGPQNPYLGLAAVYRETGRPDALAEILDRYLDLAENDVEAALELASLHEARGDAEAAASLRERTLYVAPYDVGVRAALADTYESLRHFDRAVAHRRAIVALDPPDQAGAHYRLAASLFESGRLEEAKRAVLQSLEEAPGFRDAQRLLLRIVD